MNNTQTNKPTSEAGAKLFLAILIIGWVVWYFLFGGIQVQTTRTMEDIHQQVSTDFANQYEIAKRQGDPIQICVQAGITAAAFLQAKDEANYRQWKATEKADCAKAGIQK